MQQKGKNKYRQNCSHYKARSVAEAGKPDGRVRKV